MDLPDIDRIFYPIATECTFFSKAAHRNFSKIEYILRHNTSLNKHKKIQITSCILSNHNGIKLEINSNRKYSNTWKLNKKVLINQ
jgi:hypothetical protein